jgi:hypothetical protein
MKQKTIKPQNPTVPMKINTRSHSCLSSIALATALLGTVSTTHAVSIIVQNHSFESPVTAGYIGVGQYAEGNSLVNHGWNISGANTYLINKNGSITASNVTGNQFLLFEPFADGDVMVYQNTGASFAAGTYTLTVDVGMATGFADWGQNATAEFQLLSFNAAEYGYNYSVGAAATSVSVKNHNGSLATYNYTLALDGTESFIGDTIAIVLKGNQNGSTNQNVSYDNVRLDFTAAPIPEPSSVAMLLGGIGALTLLRRRSV